MLEKTIYQTVEVKEAHGYKWRKIANEEIFHR